jgi:putative ABC transport system permease protein
MKFLRLILRNLLRSRRRTLLTMLSIAVSVFIFAALFTLPSFVEVVLASSASSARLVCHGKAGLGYSLPEAYGRRIAAMPHVVGVDMWNWFGGIYHLPSDQFPNLAVEQNEMDKVWPDWRVSRESAMSFGVSGQLPSSVCPRCNALASTSASRSCCATQSTGATCNSRS